jgi:hypothetical protein
LTQDGTPGKPAKLDEKMLEELPILKELLTPRFLPSKPTADLRLDPASKTQLPLLTMEASSDGGKEKRVLILGQTWSRDAILYPGLTGEAFLTATSSTLPESAFLIPNIGPMTEIIKGPSYLMIK